MKRVVQIETPDELIELLEEVKAAYGKLPLLLPCTDRFAFWLNEHRQSVDGHGAFLLPSRDTLDQLANKARFYRYAVERGFSLPDTRIVESKEEIERAAQEMTFPIVIKPPRRTPAWDQASGAEKVCKVENSSQLLGRGPFLLEAAGALVLQGWVRGPDSLSRELTLCMDPQSDLIASVVLEKLRQWPPGIGTGSLAMEVDDAAVLEAGRALLAPLAYVGLGQIEFKRDAVDGLLYLIEMNPGRAALNQPLCEAAGVEMTWAWYCAAAGLPRPAQLEVRWTGAKWICWKRDLRSSYRSWITGELTLTDWVRSLRGIRWSADIQLDDPLPLLADVFEKLRTLVIGGATR